MSRIELLPNLCTAANLLLGVTAISTVINQNFTLSAFLIVLAAVTDRADGIIARRYNAVSAFGKEFDSLADLVSFGVAPAALLYSSVLEKWNAAGLICFALFTLCGAFRLARFNVSSNPSFFQGVPITLAGAALAVMVIISPNPAVTLTSGFVLSFAMVSTIRVPKI